MDYLTRITDLLSDPSYIPVKAYTLFDLLADPTEDDAIFRPREFEEFSDALSELMEQGTVVLTKKNKLILGQQSSFIRGTFRATAKGHFGFVVPEEAQRNRYPNDLFISADDTAGAINGDIVMAVLKKGNRTFRGENPEGKILRVIEHTVTRVTGTLVRHSTMHRKGRSQFYVSPDDQKLNFLIAVAAEEVENAHAGDKVEAVIDQYPENGRLHAKGHITEVFGDSQSGAANYAALLRHHSIKTEFDSDTLIDADRRAAEPPILTDERLDLRDKLIFTIDGADAKDLDDAISVERNEEGYLLGVHIADVSHYVRPSSPLDREAYLRGTSIYFVDQVVPMLPKALSNGICSLNAGEDRYALSAFIQLDRDGAILHCQLQESLIHSRIRGVYSEVNDVIHKGENSEFYGKYAILFPDVLPTMVELYEILERRSHDRGALELETAEAKVILNEDGFPIDILKRERGVAERLIEQFMLCANEGVASFLSWQQMPCIYRIHETPAPEKIRTFKVFAHNAGLDTAPLSAKAIHPSAYQAVMEEASEKGIGTIVSYVLLRSLMKARYSAAQSPHFGLAIDKYCHFTSPIRRYPDLCVHRIVKELLHGGLTGGRLAELERFAADAAEASSENELKAVAAERDIEDLYHILYMQDHVGEEFDGIISSVTSFGFFVELANTCEGLVHISTLKGHYDYHEESFSLSCGYKSFRLGDSVRVRLEKADITTRKLDMIYIGDEQSLTELKPTAKAIKTPTKPLRQRDEKGKDAAKGQSDRKKSAGKRTDISGKPPKKQERKASEKSDDRSGASSRKSAKKPSGKGGRGKKQTKR